MKALLKQRGLTAALEELHVATIVAYDNVIRKKGLQHIDLVFRELQKMPKAKGDGGEGLYVRGRSGQRDMKQGIDSAWSKSNERSSGPRNEDQVFGSGADGYDNVDVMMAMSIEEPLDSIMNSGGSYHMTYKRDYLFDFEEYDGGNILLGDDRVPYTGDIHGVTRKTLNGRKQLGEYHTGCKIKTGNALKFCNHRFTQQCTKSEVAKHLGVTVIQQKNGLVKETNVTLLAKVVLYRNMGFNESGEYKKTFIRSGVGTGSVQVLQGVEFEVEPQEDHTFEVEPHGYVDHVAGSQEVQTQDLIYYHLARDKEQYSTHEPFNYREDSNEAVFAVSAVDKIYAHESLNFNNTVTCEVISKWKAGLKDNMDAQSDVYVLSNGCKNYSDDSDGYYWEYTQGLLDKAKGNVLGMNIVRDQSGNTLRVSQSMFYCEKLVQTLLEGHFILSLEGNLSGDCDVEINGKWSCIYVVGSQEYQMVRTRLDIASADVGLLIKFDRGLQTYVHVFVDFDYTMGRSITVMAGCMTLTEAAKEAIGLKGLAIKSGFELKIVVGINTSALSKAIPGPRFQHRAAYN
nr:zinc finger, CCHC-type [Tanacetum cinerariifolium]